MVSGLVRRAEEVGKRLSALSLDTELRFRSPAERAAFSQELTEAVTKLVSRYHDASAPGGREHRLVISEWCTASSRAVTSGTISSTTSSPVPAAWERLTGSLGLAAAVARDEPLWRAWLNARFPMGGDVRKSD